MSRRLQFVIGMVVFAAFSATAGAQKVVKHSIQFESKPRTYYLFVPQSTSSEPIPLIVLLHGSGRDGNSQIGTWQNLAKKESFAIVAPDSINREGWDMLSDGPDFLHAVIEEVKSQSAINPRRVYLFGHSAGGHHGLGIGLLESEYFAAVAVHAGILNEMTLTYTERAPRKIPIGLWQGTNDQIVPAVQARRSEAALVARGFSAHLTEISGHTHDYYGRANQINDAVWKFFQQHALTSDPKFQQHRFVR
jgi:poly(3-hydroxybutyrate) depolymerase